MASKDNKKKKHPLQHLIAGGTAGFVESSVCHPLDTIKTRMQLRRQTTPSAKTAASEEVVVTLRHDAERKAATAASTNMHEPGLRMSSAAAESTTVVKPKVLANTVEAPMGPIGTARRIIEREGFGALYKVC